MKIFLDDTRDAPKGWKRCFWPVEVIDLLLEHRVEVISLDHDLGEIGRNARTGMDVLTWLEKAVFENPKMHLPKILIHTANPVARNRMYAARYQINRFSENK